MCFYGSNTRYGIPHLDGCMVNLSRTIIIVFKIINYIEKFEYIIIISIWLPKVLFLVSQLLDIDLDHEFLNLLFWTSSRNYLGPLHILKYRISSIFAIWKILNHFVHSKFYLILLIRIFFIFIFFWEVADKNDYLHERSDDSLLIGYTPFLMCIHTFFHRLFI